MTTWRSVKQSQQLGYADRAPDVWMREMLCHPVGPGGSLCPIENGQRTIPARASVSLRNDSVPEAKD